MSQTEKRERMGWARGLLGVGFLVILIGLVIGRATDGSLWARYVAFAGLAAIVISLAAILVNAVMAKARGDVTPAVKES
jgi:hypothetical protein